MRFITFIIIVACWILTLIFPNKTYAQTYSQTFGLYCKPIGDANVNICNISVMNIDCSYHGSPFGKTYTGNECCINVMSNNPAAVCEQVYDGPSTNMWCSGEASFRCVVYPPPTPVPPTPTPTPIPPTPTPTSTPTPTPVPPTPTPTPTPAPACTPSNAITVCADGNPCTTDTCSSGTCNHTNVTSGTACEYDPFTSNAIKWCDANGNCLAPTPTPTPV